MYIYMYGIIQSFAFYFSDLYSFIEISSIHVKIRKEIIKILKYLKKINFLYNIH